MRPLHTLKTNLPHCLRTLVTRLLCCVLLLASMLGPALAMAASPPARPSLQTCTPPPGDDKVAAYRREAAAARAALADLGKAVAAARGDAEAINDSLNKVTFDEAMLGKFEKVAETLEKGVGSEAGRFAPLNKQLADVNTKLTAVVTAFSPFQGCGEKTDPPALQPVKDVIADYKALSTSEQEQKKDVLALEKAIKGIEGKVQEFAAGVALKTREAAVLSATLTPETIRIELAKRLPGLADALVVRRKFASVAERLSKALDPARVADLKGIVGSKPTFEGALSAMDQALKAALAKLPGWGEQVATAVTDQQESAQKTLVYVLQDPARRATEALALSTVAERARADFSALLGAFQKVLAETDRDDVPKEVLPDDFVSTKAKELSGRTTVLRTMTERLARIVEQVRGDLPVDRADWAMASIDVFYFDNVERMMQVLSPTGTQRFSDHEDLQKAVRTERVNLLNASENLREAETKVEQEREKVSRLQERLRMAQARKRGLLDAQSAERAVDRGVVQRAERIKRNATIRREQADLNKRTADRELAARQRERDADDDPTEAQLEQRAERVRRAQRAVDQAADATDEAATAEARATTDLQNAQSAAGTSEVDDELTEIGTELTTAQSALTTAETARDTATDTQRKSVRAAFLAAEVENFAFAQARDNAPFLTNKPDPRSTDPISRVVLFAFPDTRTLFIRGQRDDVDLVRQMVKEFDQPHGQAMMTLRTLEINSDGTNDGAKRALRFLRTVDEKLNAAHANITRAQAVLRNKINEQVARAAETKREEWRREAEAAEAEAAKTELPRPVVAPFQQAAPLTPEQRRVQRLKARVNRLDDVETFGFYDKRVLEALGWREDYVKDQADTSFLNAVIPPPSRSSNLAQALIVLSLASVENRKHIVAELKSEMARLDVTDGANGKSKTKTSRPDPFTSLYTFLGDQGNGSDILGFQAKLVDALRFNGITHVLELAQSRILVSRQLRDEVAKLKQETVKPQKVLDDLDAQYRVPFKRWLELEEKLKDPKGMEAAEIEKLKTERDEKYKEMGLHLNRLWPIRQQITSLQERIDPLSNTLNQLDNTDIPAILSWLQGGASGLPTDLVRKRIESAIDSGGDSGAALLAQAVGLRRSARFRFTQANESAVNLTFRKYLEQVNRDLTEIYVKPTFRDINELLLKEKLGAGIMQETSILASNRLAARVDPRGSAQLAVGEEQNVLEAARQLTNLLGLAGKNLATGVTGNPAALAGGPGGAAAATLTTAQNVLSSLDQLPREARPSVYGIATGNLFQVTPVIDPSGQALRFRFDMVTSTQIREPDNTIDPQIPRIERHSVNTEVQLADQEIRLISQFQANSRLGIGTRKSGGIPILKDIPGVSELPLVGWFVKRSGRAGETQQSFIFCQTTMYPTLSEVINVAVQSPTFTGLDTPRP